MSTIIAVAAILMVAVLPGGPGMRDGERADVTIQHMRAIETATRGFMATNLRRPCPASRSDALTSASFGVEQTSGGECTSDAGAVEYAGMPPVRALNLPEEFAFDGYGRRLEYRVDRRATVASDSALTDTASACFDMQSHALKGGIRIVGAPEAAVANDYVMWALVSFGKDKYGSYAMQGGGPLDGASDADTLANISLGGELVRREPAAAFDDIVWYSEQTKNHCCMGKVCIRGFDIPLNATGTADIEAGANIAKGDVNGDGIADLVIGNGSQSTPGPVAYILFGRKTGWPVAQSLNLDNITDSGSNPAGQYGVAINNDSSIVDFARAAAVGDVNGDGYDDVLISGRPATLVFGRSSFGASAVATSSLDGSTGLLMAYSATIGYYGTVGMGDFDGDGYKDMVVAKGASAVSNTAWIMWGRNAAGWSALGSGTPKVWDVTSITSDDGMKVSATPLLPILQGVFSMASGDVNGDGLDDLLMGGNTASSNTGLAYLIFGRSRASFVADLPAPPSAAAKTLATTAGSGWLICDVVPCRGNMFKATGSSYLGTSVLTADMNVDGYKDLVISDYNHIYVYNGKAAGSWGTTSASPYIDLSTAAAVTINTATNRPSWLGAPVPKQVTVGDVSGDGKPDLLLGVPNSGTPVACKNDAGKTVGSIYVIPQPAAGWTSGDLFSGTANSDCDSNELNTSVFSSSFRIDGAGAFDYAYIPIVTDLNRDAKEDIVVVAPGDNTNRSGTAYVLWGRRTVGWGSVYDLLSVDSLE